MTTDATVGLLDDSIVAETDKKCHATGSGEAFEGSSPGTGENCRAAGEEQADARMADALVLAAKSDYLAELAYQAGQRDPEVCARLLSRPDRLLKDPAGTIMESSGALGDKESFPDEKAPFRETSPEKRENQAVSAVWRAQIVQLFPRLEQFRFRFISEHEGGLRHHLPIYDGNGETISDPFDLEFGNLIYIVHMDGVRFVPSDWEKIQFCRAARNTLAHNKILTEKEVERVMGM